MRPIFPFIEQILSGDMLICSILADYIEETFPNSKEAPSFARKLRKNHIKILSNGEQCNVLMSGLLIDILCKFGAPYERSRIQKLTRKYRNKATSKRRNKVRKYLNRYLSQGSVFKSMIENTFNTQRL